MKQRTEEEWNRLRDNAICSILIGRTSNPYYGDWSLDSIVSEAIYGADHLVKKLKEEEQTEIQSTSVPRPSTYPKVPMYPTVSQSPHLFPPDTPIPIGPHRSEPFATGEYATIFGNIGKSWYLRVAVPNRRPVCNVHNHP